MNLVFGELLHVSEESGMRCGKIWVAGAIGTVWLDLVSEAKPGDRILLCDGVALSKVEPEKEEYYVLGHTR